MKIKNIKKTLSIFLSSIILLIFFANFVSAGCCITPGLSCEISDAGSCVTAPQVYKTGECTVLPECVRGCCCNFGTNSGTVDINYSCSPPKTFVTGVPSSAGIGTDCTCGDEYYDIDGKIERKTGGVLEGAIVKAGGISVTSDANGLYLLENVPAGAVTVVADKISAGCLPNSKEIDLVDDTTVNLVLNCQCNPTTCDPAQDAYCNAQSKWTKYDLSIPSEKTAYCNYCASDDPSDCGSENPCIANDGKCPTGCSPNINDGSLYDPECVCNDVSNSACPPWCSPDDNDDNYDADCLTYIPNCGDGYVTYPFETCENSSVLKSNQINLCGNSDCADPGETGECNCLGLSICGNLIIEGNEQCEIGGLCADGTNCNNCKCGPPQCKDNAIKPSNVIPNFDADVGQILVTWSLIDSCIPNLAGFSVWTCTKADGIDCSDKNMYTREFSGISPYKLNQSHTVPSNSEFCYYVEAIYLPNTIPPFNGQPVYADSFVEGSPDCEATGDTYCMEPHPDEFCWNNARSYCDEDNNIKPFDNCTSNYNPKRFCMGSAVAGGTVCSAIGMCDACNGLYGMFSNIDITIDDGGALPLYCHPGNQAMVEGCYLDRTNSLFSAFEYCSFIESCYDYKSEEACTDHTGPLGGGPCGKNQGCEWVWLDEGSGSPYRQLGGVCRPVSEENQKCEFCDMDRYNWLTPGCNPVTCRLFGDKCNYIGGDIPCSTKSSLTCLSYPNPGNCTGGTPVVVDVNYSMDYNRTGGTNDLTVPSQDKHGLGKCYWHTRADGTGVCLRNADNLSINFTLKIGYDCKELMPPKNLINVECESDFTNPVTKIDHYGRTFLASNLPLYSSNVKIRYDATDDRYSGNKLDTFFCIVPSTNTAICYPTNEAEDGTYEETKGSSGIYKVYYYSIDYAHNLEKRSYEEIYVDADPPTITITDPADGTALTYQDTIDVSGVTSPQDLDTAHICTYNKDTPTKKNCINNCVFGTTPCINSSTGDFTIQVNVPQNKEYDIMFDLEDLAGNQNNGLSLLAIHKNDTEPLIPIIIIEGFE